MVERRAFVAHSLVGQRAQERREVTDVSFVEIHGQHRGRKVDLVLRVEVAAAVVKADDILERCRATVVEVRRSQLDISKRRCLEGAVDTGRQRAAVP